MVSMEADHFTVGELDSQGNLVPEDPPSPAFECTPTSGRADAQSIQRIPRPDDFVTQLLRTIEALQQQQEHAESARLAAEQAAQFGNLEIAQLEQQLHEALGQAASTDDEVQGAQLELDAQLQNRVAKAELLEKQRAQMEELRVSLEDLDQLCQQKDLIIQELRSRLLALGNSEASLAQLQADTCRGPVARRNSSDSTPDAPRPSWFTASKAGLFGSFKRPGGGMGRHQPQA